MLDKTIQTVVNSIAWLNEKVYQPHIKPVVENTIQAISSGIAWTNEKIYKPYIQPALISINENIYQPYVKPLVNEVKDTFENNASFVDKTFYQPFIQPIVADINQYIYQPYFKPLQDKASAWWDETWEKYGEWVHGALDTVGFVPGLGEIADGINGLIYLGEGRYLEAAVSAAAMIPLVGDLGKGGKWGVKLSKEVVETALEGTAEKLVIEVGQEVLENASEKTVRELGYEVIEKATKETVEEAAEVAMRTTGVPTTTTLTSEQVVLVDKINNQLKLNFKDILPENKVPIELSKIEFKPSTEFRRGVHGYYDPKNGKLSINNESVGIQETIIHEGLHSISDNGKKVGLDGQTIRQVGLQVDYLSEYSDRVTSTKYRMLNEGITEMFTCDVANKMGLNDISKAYADEVRVAKALTEAIGKDTVKKSYFMSDFDGLRNKVDTLLGDGAFELINNALEFDNIEVALKIIENGVP